MDAEKQLKAKEELSRIWESINGSRTVLIERGTRLWHCGRIEKTEQIDDAKGLWATCNPDWTDKYKGFGLSKSAENPNEPTKLELEVVSDLKAADFSMQSLRKFTEEFCNCVHDNMKAVIRQWMVDNDLDAIVRANADPDEVILARPRSDTVVVSAHRL